MKTITVDNRSAVLDLPASELSAAAGEMLGEALAKMLVKTGMLADGALLTGPHLLQFAEEYLEHTPPAGSITGYLSSESSKSGYQFCTIYGNHPFTFEANITVIADNETASDDELIEALSPFLGKTVTAVLEPGEHFYGQTVKISGLSLAQ